MLTYAEATNKCSSAANAKKRKRSEQAETKDKLTKEENAKVCIHPVG